MSDYESVRAEVVASERPACWILHSDDSRGRRYYFVTYIDGGVAWLRRKERAGIFETSYLLRLLPNVFAGTNGQIGVQKLMRRDYDGLLDAYADRDGADAMIATSRAAPRAALRARLRAHLMVANAMLHALGGAS